MLPRPSGIRNGSFAHTPRQGSGCALGRQRQPRCCRCERPSWKGGGSRGPCAKRACCLARAALTHYAAPPILRAEREAREVWDTIEHVWRNAVLSKAGALRAVYSRLARAMARRLVIARVTRRRRRMQVAATQLRSARCLVTLICLAVASAGAVVSAGGTGSRLPEGPTGLARKFPGDKRVETHPDVLFVERFDEGSLEAISKRWESVKNKSIMSLSSDAPEGSADRTSLLMTHVGGKGHCVRRIRAQRGHWPGRCAPRLCRDCAARRAGGFCPATSVSLRAST